MGVRKIQDIYQRGRKRFGVDQRRRHPLALILGWILDFIDIYTIL